MTSLNSDIGLLFDYDLRAGTIEPNGGRAMFGTDGNVWRKFSMILNIEVSYETS